MYLSHKYIIPLLSHISLSNTSGYTFNMDIYTKRWKATDYMFAVVEMVPVVANKCHKRWLAHGKWFSSSVKNTGLIIPLRFLYRDYVYD